MATARKLPSGSWRCQIYDYTDEKGKRHYKSFTAKTRKEAEYLAASYKLKEREFNTSDSSITLKVAIEKYCTLKSNVLSPSTLKGYRQLNNIAYETIKELKLDKINSKTIQEWVNHYSAAHSPKSVKNAYGLLRAVLNTFKPHMRISATLPQKLANDLYVPTDNDVKTLIEYYSKNDTEMEKAVYLAAYGTMRRSEISALEAEDIKGSIIRIDKAMVDAGNGIFVIKTTKTTSSTREVEMPGFIIEKLPAVGRVVNLNPNQISGRFQRTFKHLGINIFRFHDLRHYAASMMHALGIPDVYIMQRGGWSSDHVLKKIYRGVMADYKEKFTKNLFSHLETMQHEIQHK
jgi:integrase family protein